MALDELTKPLGLPRQSPPPSRRRKALFLAAGGVVVVAGLIGAWFVWQPTTDGAGVIALDGATPAPDKTAPVPTKRSLPVGDGEGLIEAMPDGALSEPGADTVVIRDPSAEGELRLAAAPNEELLEDGPDGPLPVVGPDGTRPVDAYARPAVSLSAGTRRIAIVVGGLGLGAEGTEDAIKILPGAVTLAIAPYGEDLPLLLARARESGHELLLQIPLEPYGYPNNDPGPHTLTVDASPEQNRDRLHWLLGRITTYVGVTNYLGARFTGSDEALGPLVAEIGERGLLYFDDGSSGSSRADALAKNRTPFLRADAVIDADTDAKAIDDRLAEIEAIARRRGYAIASASAFPITIERIARFAKAAEARGFEIVPLTALLSEGRT